MKNCTIKVDREAVSSRLDQYLVQHLPEHSRAFLQKLIYAGQVQVNGMAKKAQYRLREGDSIVVTVPPPQELQVSPEEIPLDILYEDLDLIAVNKAAGMLVHPGAGHASGTLVNALLHHCRDLSGIGGVLRPGIVHRLDKGTSGVIVAAKNDGAHRALSEQFKKREVYKEYWAFAFGIFRYQSGIIETAIGRDPIHRKKISSRSSHSRKAVTEYYVERQYPHVAFLKLVIKTGRTHQIRAHLSEMGHPLVGDLLYGGGQHLSRLTPLLRAELQKDRPLLHAHCLILIHPRSGKKLTLTTPLPKDMKDFLHDLERATQ